MWKLVAVLEEAPAGTEWSATPSQSHSDDIERKDLTMRSILLWLLGVPIPIIILIALFYR